MSAVATARRRANSPAKPQPADAAQRRSSARPDLGMPAYMQKKLRVSEPGDALEGEADRVADHVTRGAATESASGAANGVQRAADEKKQDPKAGGGGKDQKAPAAAGGKEQKPAAGGAAGAKDQKPAGGKEQQGAKGTGKEEKGGEQKAKPTQQPEKKEQAARKEVNADDKVEKAKEEQKKKEEKTGKGAAKEDKGEQDVQAKSRPQISRLADASVSREAAGGTAAADTEQRLGETRGQGKELPEHTRAAMESGFGEDFSAVRVHDDAEADGLSRDLNARAFTVGNDIYFAQGQFAPESGDGRHLLAHELTHVLQQGGAQGVQRRAMRAKDDKKKGAGKVEDDRYTGPEGEIDKEFKKKTREIVIPKLTLPKVKAGLGAPPFTLSPVRREDNPTDQAGHWKTATPTADIAASLDEHIEKQKKKTPKSFQSGRNLYFLKVAGKEDLVGTKSQVVAQLRNPKWNRNGKAMTFQIDHKFEVQLGGEDDKDNVWLLEAATNGASGNKINSTVRRSLTDLIVAAQAAGLWKTQPDFEAVRYGPKITISDAAFTGPPSGGKDKTWEADEITGGKQLKDLRPMTLKEIKDTGLGDDSDRELYTIYTRAGGTARVIALKPGQKNTSVKKDFLPGLEGAQISIDGASGSISGTIEIKQGKKAIKKPIDVELGLKKMKGEDDDNSYVVEQKDLKKAFGNVEISGWSPVEFTDVDFTPEGLAASALVHIDVPIIKQGVTADLTIGPEGLDVTGTIEAGAISLPGPVQVTGGAFYVKLGSHGLGAGGSVNFEVQGLGTGRITANVDADGPELEGSFEGQSDTFSKFEINLHYNRAKGLWGGGSLAVAKGKLPGCESASATVKVEDKQWSATGTVVPTVKAIKEVTIGAEHVEGQGFKFMGKAVLGSMTCVSGGEVNLVLAQVGGGWSVSGDGFVDLAIPGLDAAKATVSYKDGIFTAEVTVGYKAGRLSGSVTVGVSNQPKPAPVPAEAAAAAGAPAAPKAAGPDTLTFYGAGSVSIQITPWLKGTIGIAFLLDGTVIVTGEVALGEIQLVPEKTFEQPIFSIGIDIPIVGVSFAGQRIGIFATVGGGASFKAGIGPVTLRNTALKITYCPQHEENTQVHGTAQVYCPASAGLSLEIHGGLGIGIPIVSATVGLRMSGEVGIKGAASLDVVVDWGPQQPLSFTTTGKLEVQPVFKLGLDAYATVEADLLIKTITLYEETWNLAGYELPVDAKFSVEFPVNYTEGKGLDLDLSKITVKAPEIDPIETVKKMIG